MQVCSVYRPQQCRCCLDAERHDTYTYTCIYARQPLDRVRLDALKLFGTYGDRNKVLPNRQKTALVKKTRPTFFPACGEQRCAVQKTAQHAFPRLLRKTAIPSQMLRQRSSAAAN